jgi:class 3 adenylate cyclase/tetratricopeptide (TPR) repeat protein
MKRRRQPSDDYDLTMPGGAQSVEAASLDGWRRAVLEAERRGELLSAFDLADRGLVDYPDDGWLKHRAVLALARTGSTAEAARRFDDYGLRGSDEEDASALGARLEKDVALAAEGAVREEHLVAASDAYEAIFARSRGYYPAINAATLLLLRGEDERSRELAERVLELVDPTDESYYGAATIAEAQLLLGDVDAARTSLERASSLHEGDFGAVSTTRRQLRMICERKGIALDVLDVFAGPAVAHFCGHRIAPDGEPGRFTAVQLPAVEAAIVRAVALMPCRYAYGALASGADILWAEALLAEGCELQIVLPFAAEEFIETSVASSGQEWVARFERVRAAASAETYATEDAFLGDDVLYRYGSELAMGLACLRARHLEGEVHQFALWDGEPAGGEAGTAIDVATWRASGHPSCVVDLAGEITVEPPVNRPVPAAPPRPGGRVVRSMLFADVKGFSKLTDEQLPRFAQLVLGAFAEVLNRYDDTIGHRNTWGDALYVVLEDVTEAARCALDLQDVMGQIDLEEAGLPPHLALRLGAHLGPVYPTHDPVIDVPGFMGSHVSRTARIEPVTPPGAVYVTQQFAAALVLEGSEQFACDYVGHMPAAKDFGRLRMYGLRRRAQN